MILMTNRPRLKPKSTEIPEEPLAPWAHRFAGRRWRPRYPLVELATLQKLDYVLPACIGLPASLSGTNLVGHRVHALKTSGERFRR